MRRLVKGIGTKRSELDAEHLIERLRERGVAQLREDDEVWAIVDPSELRKPYAREMPSLMRVRKLGSEKGTVPGYRTLNVLGVGRGGRRGILYHRLFSSTEPGFASESAEIQTALDTVGAALAGKTVTYLLDSQFETPQQLNPNVPLALSNLIMESVSTNPKKRPPDMEQVITRLELVKHVLSKQQPNAAQVG